MKVDMFAHIMPQRYYKALRQMGKTILEDIKERNPSVLDIDSRLRLMDRYPDVLQVLTVMQPPLETFCTPKEATELAAIANDELAELVVKYPDKFVAAVACLPMNDMGAALEETDRAINQLGLKGVQIYGRINGEPVDKSEFRPLYEKMVGYDLPIWIHPSFEPCEPDAGVFNLVFETTYAMHRLVSGGIIQDYPGIKFIAHHCGAIVPLLEGRLQDKEQYRKFYGDTATYGSTAQLMCGYAFFGAGHLLFGTDSPLGPRFGCTFDVIKSVERMAIPDSEKEKIFLQNAIDLLKMSI
jgi:aminocarboxymuconate-semialdehyde decarboxylase